MLIFQQNEKCPIKSISESTLAIIFLSLCSYYIYATMGFIVLAILLVGTFLVLLKSPFGTGLSRRTLIGGWLIKLSYTVIYCYIFIFHYGGGQLDLDLWNFYNDSHVIQEYGKQNPGEYAQIMFGFNSNDEELLAGDLRSTDIWSYGDNGDFINDNRLIIRINSLIHFISFENVYVHILLMSFIAFLGLLALFRAFKKYVQNQNLFFYTLCFFPTVAFWTSGLTKEALLLFALGIFFLQLTKLIEGFSWKKMIGLALAVFLLVFNKPHVGLILIPLSSVLILGILKLWNGRYMWFFAAGIVAIGALSLYTPDRINLVSRTTQKQKDLMNMAGGGVFFINDSAFCKFDYEYLDHFTFGGKDSTQLLKTAKGEYKLFGKKEFHPFEMPADSLWYDLYLIQAPANSYIDVEPIAYSKAQLIKNIPSSLSTVFVRPFPSDPGSQLKIAVFLGNLTMMGMLIFGFIKRVKLNDQQKYFVFLLISTALIISLIIGWTTPILGAVARYKSAVDLLLLIAIFIMMKPLTKSKHEES